MITEKEKKWIYERLEEVLRTELFVALINKLSPRELAEIINSIGAKQVPVLWGTLTPQKGELTLKLLSEESRARIAELPGPIYLKVYK
jgi:hypothetical protein